MFSKRHTVAGSERFVRRLKFLNCIFLKGKMLYNQIFRSFWPGSSQLEYGPKRRHLVLRIQKNTVCAVFQKCLCKLWGTFYLMKHRRRCQQIIGFARCNFNWIQEFGTSFSLFPACFVLPAPSAYVSLLFWLLNLKIAQDFCLRSPLAEITDGKLWGISFF